MEDMLGQVFTPSDIADKMVALLFDGVKKDAIYSILDPAVGPSTFPTAMMNYGILNDKARLTAIDIDESMVLRTRECLSNYGIKHNAIKADYLEYDVGCEFDFAIFNPPYVRQEWIEDKSKYKMQFKDKYNIDIPGMSNLYVYFVVKTIMDLKNFGTFVCILYDSWQYTIFGKWLAHFLEHTCRDIEVYPIGHQPFDGRLINATIIKAVKATKTMNYYANSNINTKKQTQPKKKVQEGFSSINEIFKPKRGLRLKQVNFFLSDASMINYGATPFLKKVGRIKGYNVPAQHSESALLVWNDNLDTRIINELEMRIQKAKQAPEDNVAILTWYNERPESWFIHPEPPISSVVFNYYMRNRPRHIFNPGRAYSDNFYGLTVLDEESSFAYMSILNSTAICNEILEHSRKQGNGLYKIQLFEYRDVLIPDIVTLSEKEKYLLFVLGKALVDQPEKSEHIIAEIDHLLWDIYHYSELSPDKARRNLNTKI